MYVNKTTNVKDFVHWAAKKLLNCLNAVKSV